MRRGNSGTTSGQVRSKRSSGGGNWVQKWYAKSMNLRASSHPGRKSSTTRQPSHKAPSFAKTDSQLDQSWDSTTSVKKQEPEDGRRSPPLEAVTDESLEGPAAASHPHTTGSTEATAEANPDETASDVTTQTPGDQVSEGETEGDDDPDPPHAEGDEGATVTSEAPQEQSQVDPATEDPKEV